MCDISLNTLNRKINHIVDLQSASYYMNHKGQYIFRSKNINLIMILGSRLAALVTILRVLLGDAATRSPLTFHFTLVLTILLSVILASKSSYM